MLKPAGLRATTPRARLQTEALLKREGGGDVAMAYSSDNLKIRRLDDADLDRAFVLIRQLRTHLSRNEFVRRVKLQEAQGYELHGAFEEGSMVAVLGMRAVHTLARGAHLHVDDLVVDASARGRGIGKALLMYAEHDAARHGLGAVFLDSRTEVIGFYERQEYVPHTALLMRKRLPGSIA